MLYSVNHQALSNFLGYDHKKVTRKGWVSNTHTSWSHIHLYKFVVKAPLSCNIAIIMSLDNSNRHKIWSHQEQNILHWKWNDHVSIHDKFHLFLMIWRSLNAEFEAIHCDLDIFHHWIFFLAALLFSFTLCILHIFNWACWSWRSIVANIIFPNENIISSC